MYLLGGNVFPLTTSRIRSYKDTRGDYREFESNTFSIHLVSRGDKGFKAIDQSEGKTLTHKRMEDKDPKFRDLVVVCLKQPVCGKARGRYSWFGLVVDGLRNRRFIRGLTLFKSLKFDNLKEAPHLENLGVHSAPPSFSYPEEKPSIPLQEGILSQRKVTIQGSMGQESQLSDCSCCKLQVSLCAVGVPDHERSLFFSQLPSSGCTQAILVVFTLTPVLYVRASTTTKASKANVYFQVLVSSVVSA